MKPNNTKQDEWKERFEERWNHRDIEGTFMWNAGNPSHNPKTIKDFIQSEIDISYQQGLKDGKKELIDFIDDSYVGEDLSYSEFTNIKNDLIKSLENKN